MYTNAIKLQELTENEKLETNGGVSEIVEKIVEILLEEAVEWTYENYVKPSFNNLLNAGSTPRAENWYKYSPKC